MVNEKETTGMIFSIVLPLNIFFILEKQSSATDNTTDIENGDLTIDKKGENSQGKSNACNTMQYYLQ